MQENNTTLIGKSAVFENLLRQARIVAATDAATLILGENGSGKELLAKELHQHSSRRQQAFVTINCAALPEALAEAELFGHRKGAFTGADQANPGRIRQAEGGTLFLDEIGELPLALQAKLLRFLENGECQALGGETYRVDVRVIAATNRNLTQAVAEGLFRQDLYYRLNIVPLTLPALRERQEDIPALLEHYSHQFAVQYGLSPLRFDTSALKKLRGYHWPGNIRELRNLCERMAILMQGQTLYADNLPADLLTSATPSHDSYDLPDGGIHLESIEIDFIRQALEKTEGNRSKAARLLGLTRDTLLYRMKKYAMR